MVIRRQPANVVQRNNVTRAVLGEWLNAPVALAESIVLEVGDFAQARVVPHNEQQDYIAPKQWGFMHNVHGLCMDYLILCIEQEYMAHTTYSECIICKIMHKNVILCTK
jgi:hypothetical protein